MIVENLDSPVRRNSDHFKPDLGEAFMHVMAVNGSPRKEKSSTGHILVPLLEGMRAAGATTELVHLGKLRVKPCLGCFLCWVKTPGRCVQKDDMPALFERFVQADLVVFGTPLYHYHMSGLLKNFIDRTLAAHEPWLVQDPSDPERSAHPDRYPKDRAMLLVSPCGFPEFEYFGPMVQYFQYWAQKLHWRYIGEILRPAGEILYSERHEERLGWYYDLVRQAGEQIVNLGIITPDLQGGLRQDLFPGGAEVFRNEANKQWMETMAEFGLTGKPPGQK
jgi:putative NADPH-quinone reductase